MSGGTSSSESSSSSTSLRVVVAVMSAPPLFSLPLAMFANPPPAMDPSCGARDLISSFRLPT
eukprot:8334657-Pyramimonas_sp.AAC.2